MSDTVTKSAEISECGQYRYSLSRVWDASKPTVLFVMLNPSTADAENDDPTIRRCIDFAKRWGYGGLAVGNLFALRATKPADMKKSKAPVGAKNNETLLRLAGESALIVAAWGKDGKHLGRDLTVRLLLPNLHYLKLTNEGQPYHPLYLPATLEPIAWNHERTLP